MEALGRYRLPSMSTHAQGSVWKDVSYRLNSLHSVIWGIIWGTSIWLIKGDTRSLDYGACGCTPLSYPARNRAQLSSTSSRAVTVGTGCGEQGFPRNKFKERFLGYRFLRVATHQIRKWRGADLCPQTQASIPALNTGQTITSSNELRYCN